MIKIGVSNMSCGHCRLKINAALETNGYRVIQFDMNNQTILIDTTVRYATAIKNILQDISYVVDDRLPINDIEEYTIWGDSLEDEENYAQFSEYLNQKNIDIIGFNEEEFGMIVLCTEDQYVQIMEYIQTLSQK